MDDNIVINLTKEVSELVGLIRGTNGDGIVSRYNKLETCFYNFLVNRLETCPMSKEFISLNRKLDEIERENKEEHKAIITELEKLKDKPGLIAKRAWSRILEIVIAIVLAAAIAFIGLKMTERSEKIKQVNKSTTEETR